MTDIAALARRRLWNQHVTRTELSRPADVVRRLGAVQAQEFDPAKWGLALRMRDGVGDADLERAFANGEMLRTHVMRPTWHFVAPDDIRWLLELTAPRVHQLVAPYRRRFELDQRMLVRGTRLMERALRDGQHLTRIELGAHLSRARMAFDGFRLGLVCMFAELEGVICSGPRRGRRFTYALVAERAPAAKRLPAEEALATLARRYFTSHGPATVRDFVWWSGLTTADAKRGLEMNGARAEHVEGRTYWTIGDEPSRRVRLRGVHLLPIYDEYVVAYRDRDVVPHGPSLVTEGSGNPVNFRHSLVIDGQVSGTWRTARRSNSVHIELVTFRKLNQVERAGLGNAVQRFERFLGVSTTVTSSSGC